MTSISESDINKGQAVYTPLFLRLYNLVVLDFSNKWIWKCPKKIQLAQFNQYVTTKHLDIGVGTGYYLKQCQWPAGVQLSLMDLNPNCLAHAKKILSNINPQLHLADIFKPQLALSKQFNSISMNYLLHCLPGTMEEKECVIANSASMLMPGGILFGATILADKHLHTKSSQGLADFYNKKQIFSNQHDTLQSLQRALTKYLVDVNISVVGCVALFRGTCPA